MILSEKDGDPVRKSLLLILVLLLALFCAGAAAETEYPLEAISGRMSFDESTFIVLTPWNLSDHPDLLSSIGKSADELRSDWEARGVLAQAWSKDQKTCVEVSITQDDLSAKYYDVNARTGGERREYQSEFVTKLKQNGYSVFDPKIKKHNNSGYYVEYQYLFNGENQHRGIGAAIIRNGYSLLIDYQVYDRKPRKSDEDRSRHIINTVIIDTVSAAPAASVSGEETPEAARSSDIPAGAANMLSVTSLPPEKTNTGVFKVEGRTYPGSEVIVVAMRWSGSSYQFPAVVKTNGDYSANVSLPAEGLYMITVNMCINDVTVTDMVLNSVTFNKTVLPFALHAEVPAELTSDELVLSGTTEKNVEIQCIVMRDGNVIPIKTVKTNGNGTFKFNIPTEQEGQYDITLVFSKKNLSTERKNWIAVRKLSDSDKISRIASTAVRVNYNTLVRKPDNYYNKTLSFDAYITDVSQSGDQWIITAAQKLNRKKYSNFLVYISDTDPGLTAGTRVKIYGTYTGPYEIQSEEGTVTYPGFDYLCIK